jgi:hypothetical protein
MAFAVTTGCLALILLQVFQQETRIDTTTLGLIVLAAVPWVLPYIKSIKVGDTTVVIDIKQARAVTAMITNQDPRQMNEQFKEKAVLLSHNQEVEAQIRAIARKANVDADKGTLDILGELFSNKVLQPMMYQGLVSLVSLGNQALAGAVVTPDASKWLEEAGPEVLQSLKAVHAAQELPLGQASPGEGPKNADNG